MIAAMKAKEPVKLAVMRGLIAACTNELVSKGRGPDGALTEEEVLSLIVRASKQRKDSIEQFEAAGRHELAEPEKAELVIIESYLPATMSREQIETIARAKMAELGASTKADAGKLTGALMKELKGQADGADVKAVVDNLLS